MWQKFSIAPMNYIKYRILYYYLSRKIKYLETTREKNHFVWAKHGRKS